MVGSEAQLEHLLNIWRRLKNITEIAEALRVMVKEIGLKLTADRFLLELVERIKEGVFFCQVEINEIDSGVESRA